MRALRNMLRSVSAFRLILGGALLWMIVFPMLRTGRAHVDPALKQSPAIYSTFECTENKRSHNNRAERSCVFRNVCHVPGEDGLTVHYYQHPDRPRPILFDDNRVHFEFPKDFVFRGGIAAQHENNTWAPTLVKQAFPEDWPMHEASVAVLFEVWDAANIGHFIADHFFATWYLQYLFGFEPSTRDVQILEFPEFWWSPRSNRFRDAYYPILSKRKFEPLAGLGRVCFSNLIVGVGPTHIGSYTTGANPQMTKFREFVYRQYGINQGPPRTHQVVLIHKRGGNGGRHFVNHEELLAYLRAAFPDVPILDFDPAKHSVRAQMEWFGNSTVWISPPGGMTMSVVFLPPGATSLISDVAGPSPCMVAWCPNNPSGPYSKRFGAEFNFNGRAQYLQHMYYPVCFESEVRFEVPAGMDPAKKPYNEYYADIVVDLPRMAAMLDLALISAEDHIPGLKRIAHDPLAGEKAQCPPVDPDPSLIPEASPSRQQHKKQSLDAGSGARARRRTADGAEPADQL